MVLPIGLEFSERDKKVLQDLLEDFTHPIVIEVGSWIGTSTLAILESISRKGGKLYCIDHWGGTPDVVPHQKLSQDVDVFLVFKYRLKLAGFWDCVCPIMTDSVSASEIIKDKIADLVFIDANHSYESVKKDIEIWQPKLKLGGILCGHDYSPSHQGLIRAVDEAFNFKHYLDKRPLREQSSIWWVKR